MNTELKITKENALAAFKNGGKKERELLTNLFGKHVFIVDPVERIQTFEDVLEINGIDPDEFEHSCRLLTTDEIAYRQIKLIVKSYNQGWAPNWGDCDEYKYCPWFRWMGSASGFSCDDCDCDYPGSAVGSRLVFKDRDHAIDAGKKFQAIYNQFLKP